MKNMKKTLRPRVLALILAGGSGSRLDVLTQERAKPAMPFAGTYRLIDFALSNCMHSGISDVWVIEQYQLHSLNEHLSNGRPWDLDRTYGGLQVLPPYQDDADEDAAGQAESHGGYAVGNADAIYRHRRLIQEFAPDLLLVLSADHVYTLDYREVIEHHIKREADVTIVTTEVAREKASRFGNVKVGKNGRVTDFAYKPEKPFSSIVTTEVFVYTTRALFDMFDELMKEKKKSSDKKSNKKSDVKPSAKDKKSEKDSDDGKDNRLQDFGHELLPQMIAAGNAFDFPLKGYWRDLGTLRSYWHSHMELLDEKPGLILDDPTWSILTVGAQLLPARVHKTAKIENSFISSGCVVRGTVIHSILAPGVVVEEEAVIKDSVVLNQCHIESNANISGAIIDVKVRIGARAKIGKPVKKDKVDDDDLTVIGAEARIKANGIIKAGERVKPKSRS